MQGSRKATVPLPFPHKPSRPLSSHASQWPSYGPAHDSASSLPVGEKESKHLPSTVLSLELVPPGSMKLPQNFAAYRHQDSTQAVTNEICPSGAAPHLLPKEQLHVNTITLGKGGC